MSKGGASPSAVPAAAVDPFALASAQTGTNVRTAEQQQALQNATTVSPYGASFWQGTAFDPNTGLPTSYALNQQLSPQLQQLFGSQTNLAQALAGGGAGLAPGAANVAGVGQNLVSQAGGIGGLISPTLNLSNIAPISTLTPGQFRTNVPQGPIQAGVAAGGPVQSTVNTDFATQIKQAQDAALKAQTQYLDPQFQQGESNLRQRLADQGIQEGTPAYSRALLDFNNQKQQAYQSAQDQAVAAGNAQQQALFGESLGAGQFANQAQAQLFGQGVTQGTFANQAQAQQFGQGVNLADIYNQAVLAATGQQNTAAQLGLQQAQAAQQTPVNTLAQLIAAGTGAYGAGVGSLGQLGSLANLWPTGPLSIPTMGGTPSTIAPTNLAGLTSGAAAESAAARQAQQTGFGNLVTGANLGSQALTGEGLFGAGGLLGGGLFNQDFSGGAGGGLLALLGGIFGG